MNRKISKLTKVQLREIWPNEARDFSPWLAQPDNLRLLSDEIGIQIELIKTEASTGKFSVDMLAQEEGSEKKIIIENQLEPTDHDHLGKCITYASGYDADIVIWIVKDIHPEHQKAVEWLNDKTDAEIGFFLIKLEACKIDDSLPAPKFEIIVQPNNWAKLFKSISDGMNESTELRRKQLNFWTEFQKYVTDNVKGFNTSSPRPVHRCTTGAGFSGGGISGMVLEREKFIRCMLYCNKNKIDFYDFLADEKEQIEKELNNKVIWRPGELSCSIHVSREVSDVFDESQYPEYFAWLSEQIITFKQVFGKYHQEYQKSSEE